MQVDGNTPRGRVGMIRVAVMPLVALVLFLLSCLPGLGGGMALAAPSPRGAGHDGFGRMVFDWDSPVKWSADVVNGQLVVRFERPVSGDPKILLKPLSQYLKGVSVSPDKRMLTFSLATPIRVKSFVSGNSTVVDMLESKGEADASAPPPARPAPQPQVAVAAAPAPVAPLPATGAPTQLVSAQAPEMTPAPSAAPPVSAVRAAPMAPVASAAPSNPKVEGAIDLPVRGGEHTGFNRVVFDWPKPVNYTVNVDNGTATIAFDRPANVNTTALTSALPPDVRFVAAKPQGKGTALVFALPPDMRVRHFTNGPRVALDMVRAADSVPPIRQAGAPEPTLAPAPGTLEQPPAARPLADAEDMKPLPSVAAENGPGGPAAPEDLAPPAAVSLGVGFDQPSGAAAFRRAGWLWLVFDRKSEIDTKLLKRTGGDVVLFVEQVMDAKNGSAVRLITKPGYNPTVRKEGQLWVFDLSQQPVSPKRPLSISRQFDFEDRGRLIIPVADAPAQPVIFRDPEVGDTIQVMPLLALGAGVKSDTLVPGAELLPTAQGVALVPLADGAHLDGNRNGVEVSMPGGLYLSRDVPQPVDDGPMVGRGSALASAGGPMDIARWARGGADKFEEEHQKLLQRLAQVKPEDKNAQRLEVARHYLANGMAAEAMGILRLIGESDPARVETAPFRAVRGVANYMMHRDNDAIADLSHPSLANDAQAQIWLAAAKARSSGDLAKNALQLRLAGDEVRSLTPRLRMALGGIAAQSAAAAGDTKAATRIIEGMNGPGLNKRDSDMISYLQGAVAEAGSQWEQALAKYRDAEDGEDRPARAYAARARIELQLRRNQITAGDAVKQLQKLRFAWRGDEFEYPLLKRLGELMLADGQYGEGLRLLHTIITYHGDNPDIGSVQKMMSDAFEKLYLDGAADRMSPIAAIGLFDEFQELTPAGTKGDEMIRKLADRLAAVDLLDRAEDLLRHQVQFRLNGLEKARVGARLAFLELSDRKANEALQSLEASETPNLPSELYDQRRYLRVRALADLGRTAEALALIMNDQSDTAKQLRAEIYWDLKRWSDAAAAIESTIEKPEGNAPLQPGMAKRLIDLSTAMTLARDEKGLQRLRRAYGSRMAASEYKEAFDLLTSESERGIIDYRRVSEKIKLAENFQTFMNDWKNRVQAKGLSSMN